MTISDSERHLAELGWRPFFSTQVLDDEPDRCLPVRVMAVHRGKIAVSGSGPDRLISPHMADAAGPEEHPAVGDWLLIDRETQQPARILRRQNLLKRHAGRDRKLQLIAANVDTLFIVASCNEDFNIARLERYLVLARDVDVHPVVVLTKSDLIEMPDRFIDAARDLQSGLLVQSVNARDPRSVADLAEWCGPGQTVALVGSSGVGKSTLVNTLTGSDRIATQAVRVDDGKGRHTTTVREMHRLDHGGWLLDTPGMRALELSDTATGLAEVFDDIATLARDCRFSNCGHDVEPDCAVRDAIESGALAPLRLARWRKLMAENALNTENPGQRRSRAKTPEELASGRSRS